MAKTKVEVRLIVQIDHDGTTQPEALAQHVKDTFECTSGWQIFGEQEPFDESYIDSVEVKTINL